MLTNLDEERCFNEVAKVQNVERLKMRIKYLEKDNKDLQMDLEDVEATLQINKTIINSLLDTKPDMTNDSFQLIKKCQKEVEVLAKANEKLSAERDEIKAQLLVAEQVSLNVKSKEEEISSHYDIEINRLVEQVEKKEYTLQLLEQRLFDCEKFLRKWGRDDPFVRDQLKMLKINPDLKKKKITNIVEENKLLKDQLKESLDEIEKLHKKVIEMSKHPDETTFLKESIIHNRSKIDMYMANEMFGDDLDQITEDNKEHEITNLATQASTRRNKEGYMGQRNEEDNRKSKKNKMNVDKELEAFESRSYNQIMFDVKKIKSIKEAYPEEYNSKLETNQDMLQQQLKRMQKEIIKTRIENVQLRDMNDIYKDNYEKVLHAFEKYKKNDKKTLAKQLFASEMGNLDKTEKMKNDIETGFNNIRSQARRSELVETFRQVDSTLNQYEKKKTRMSNVFNELSSIAVDPEDLPKDFKTFASETIDEKEKPFVPSTDMKMPKTITNKNMKVSKLKDYDDIKRKNIL